MKSKEIAPYNLARLHFASYFEGTRAILGLERSAMRE
jgi:hypothetical protein